MLAHSGFVWAYTIPYSEESCCGFELKDSHFPMHFRLPVNWKTPFGYVVTILIGSYVGLMGHCAVAVITSFAASSFWMLRLTIIDVANDFPILNVLIDLLEDKNHRIIQKNCFKLVQGFCHAKELSISACTHPFDDQV